MNAAKLARGFTLIEVLIAMAILAIGLTALIKGSSDHTANAAYLRERSIAGWVAANQLQQLQLEREWPAIGKRDGKTEMGGLSWHWQAEISETPDKDVRKILVAVARERGAASIAKMQGFLGNPALRAKPEQAEQ